MKIVSQRNRKTASISYTVVHDTIKDETMMYCLDFIIMDKIQNDSDVKLYTFVDIILDNRFIGYELYYNGEEVFAAFLDIYNEY